jgi:hypothetical protein
VRLRLVVALLLVALALPLSVSAASLFKTTFTAPTHTPKINAKWVWTIKVTTAAGKPLAATISAQVVDPIGGVHPVEYGCCAKKFVTNVRIVGRFSDFVQYPLAAKGYRLTFRVLVKTRLGKRAVQYWLTPR